MPDINFSYANKVAGVETSGGRNMGAPGSAHQGPYQIAAGWGGSGSDMQRLQQGTQKNYDGLSKTLGRPPTENELYLAHQQGVHGATQLINNPDKPAGLVVPASHITGNGGDPTMTAGEFINKQSQRFGGSVDVAGGGFRNIDGKMSDIGPSTSGSADRAKLEQAHGGDVSRAADDAMTKQGENAFVNHDDIVDYLRTGGHNIDPQKQPWCAAFVGAALEHAGIPSANSNVATSYLNWGKPAAGGIQKGDVLVISRGHQAGETGGTLALQRRRPMLVARLR
jgi:hypothetical protein